MNLGTKNLLLFDSCAGSGVGLIVLCFCNWFAEIYGFSVPLTVFMGAANLSYGIYSGALALRVWRGNQLALGAVRLLVGANLAWVLPCVLIAGLTWSTSSHWGKAHLFLEALFVGGLALVEKKYLLRSLQTEMHSPWSC